MTTTSDAPPPAAAAVTGSIGETVGVREESSRARRFAWRWSPGVYRISIPGGRVSVTFPTSETLTPIAWRETARRWAAPGVEVAFSTATGTVGTFGLAALAARAGWRALLV